MRTFGKIVWDGSWKVTGEPHVMIRIKRLFGKVDKYRQGGVALSDSPENARELEWFCQRYPLEMSQAHEARLRDRAQQHRQRETEVAEILGGNYTPAAFNLAVPAREYQRVAADLLLRTGGLLLADDVGIGKTCSAICALTDPRTRPALVVTLTHLPRQWAAEIKRFAPTLRVHIVKKGTPYPLTKNGSQLELVDSGPDVIVINYHKLAGWAGTLTGKVRSVIYDECQELRHAGTGRYHAAKCISDAAQFRLGLSATPFYNLGDELHTVIECLRPNSIGDRSEFLREWCKPMNLRGQAEIAQPKAFGAYVREQGIMLRRTRADVGRELPPITSIPHHVDSDTSKLDAIGDAAAELAKIILSGGGRARGEEWRASQELSHLVRQATGIAKAPYVADFVRLLVESGEKVVLYGWHREVYSLWESRLKGLNPVFFTGTESVPQKQESLRKFIAGESSVFVMSLRAGAGLDGLQKVCRTVVFGELDWSPGVHEQCAGRVARDGQADPVMIYYLITDSGSDPIVADTLGVKTQQITGVRDPDAEMIEKLEVDKDHVKKLARAMLAKRQQTEEAAA